METAVQSGQEVKKEATYIVSFAKTGDGISDKKFLTDAMKSLKGDSPDWTKKVIEDSDGVGKIVYNSCSLSVDGIHKYYFLVDDLTTANKLAETGKRRDYKCEITVRQPNGFI